MKGVISYFPSPGVIHNVVSICIPSEQEFGGSVEIRRLNTAIPNETEYKRPDVFIFHLHDKSVTGVLMIVLLWSYRLSTADTVTIVFHQRWQQPCLWQ